MPEPEDSLGYTVGTWAGRPNYQCTQCPWNTLHLDKMEIHASEHASWKAMSKIRPLTATLYDPSGRVIETMPEDEGKPDN